jgi:hypothetical protein
MTTSVRPRASRTRRSVSSICATSVAVRPAITSSSRTSRAPVAIARATSSRFCPESVSVAGGLRGEGGHADVLEHRHRRGVGGVPVAQARAAEHRRGAQVLEHRQARERLDDLEGAGDAEAADAVGREAVDAPAGEGDRPVLGRALPAIRLKSVVLPAPLAPMMPTVSPASTANETPESAMSPPKRLPRSCTSSSGAARRRPCRPRRLRACRP